MSAVPSRTGTPSGTRGSATTTSTVAGPSVPINGPTLRLRAEPEDQSQTRRIQWAEDVIDNEGMGKKSSKVCCIYHKPKNAGDSSSDESSSSSDSDSDSEPDLSRAQPPKRRSRRQKPDDHDHDCEDDEHKNDRTEEPHKSKGKAKVRKPSPNAYERVPQRKKDKT